MSPERNPAAFLLVPLPALVLVCNAWAAAPSAAADHGPQAQDRGAATVEVLATRFVIPPVDVEIFEDRPSSAEASGGQLGIGVKVHLVLDERSRVLEARPDAITWYNLRDGAWSSIEAARLDASDAARLGEAAVQAARSSIFRVQTRGDERPSPPYRAITEIRWLVPEKGPLPSGIGGEFRSELNLIPRGQGTGEGGTETGEAGPELLEKVVPTYPEDARAAKAEGKAVIEARIATDGTVSEARVLRSANEAFPSFDEAALEAVKKWRYEPAMKDGKPVPVWLTVVVAFALE